MRILSYCKINLCLEVLGRRPDGYHDLATIFQTVSLGDELILKPNQSSCIRLLVDGNAPTGEDNIVHTAAKMLLRSKECGIDIILRKGIPSGAGLGGGSSDAASTLEAVNKLCNLHLSHEHLLTIASSLGADVPFFLYGGTAVGRDRGDKIIPLPYRREYYFLLHVPPFRLEKKTQRVFAALQPREYTNGNFTVQLSRKIAAGQHITNADLYNSLFPAAVRVWPQLAQRHDALQEITHQAWVLSGAGPTLYTIVESLQVGEKLLEDLRQLDGQSFLVRSTPVAREYQDL